MMAQASEPRPGLPGLGDRYLGPDAKALDRLRVAAAGLGGAKLPDGPTYPNCELSTTMVEQGQGVSLAYDAVVRGTLATGRLERLFDIVTQPMAIYSVACQEARADEPRIAAFREWLRGEAEADGVLPAGQPEAAE